MPGVPRRFQLNRQVDATGVSGTGVVANGVCFDDGVCVMRWAGVVRSTVVYATTDDLIAIHGHDGMTTLEWID